MALLWLISGLLLNRQTQSVWLADLDLSKSTQGWGKPQANHSVDGHPLRIRGQAFEHGFGTHALGRMFVDLHGTARRFTATVGIDDETPVGQGSVEFMVVQDSGKVLWRSGILRRADAPKAVDVNLIGVGKIGLIVTTAGDGFEFDHADWADAQFSYAGAAPVSVSHVGADPVVAPASHLSSNVRPFTGRNNAKLPPLGWNSYDAFGDNVKESEILDNARYMAKNLLPFGWDTVVVDYRWYDPGAHNNDPNGRAGAPLTMDRFGRLEPSSNRFPSASSDGFKALADQVHRMGLKFGIHIMRGIPRLAVTGAMPIEGSKFTCGDAGNLKDVCGWCPDMYGLNWSGGENSPGQAYYDSIFRLYAKWGVDYVKMDDTSEPYHTDDIAAVRRAIDKCGRAIVYSLSPGETPVADAQHVMDHANLWRVSGDFWDSWGALDHEFALAAKWQPYAGPNHWPDADMIPIGHLSVGSRSVGNDRRTNFTKAEQVTLMSLWALLPSPMMLGANLPDNDPWTESLFMNEEVMALPRDASPAAKRVSEGNEEGLEIWSRKLSDGSTALGVFNRAEFDQNTPIDSFTDFLPMGLPIRDMWQHKHFGVTGAHTPVVIPSHGALLLRVSARK